MQTSTRPRSSLTGSVRFPENVLFRALGSEAVLLELETGEYYGLDETALRMFTLLREHGRVESVYRALLDEYDVSRERLREDLLSFIDHLASRSLVEVDAE